MSRTVIILPVLTLLLSMHLIAQEAADGTIYCPFRSSPLSIAVPEMVLESSIGGDDQALVGEIEKALRDALVVDELFAIRGPADFSWATLTGYEGGEFDLYRSFGCEVALLISMRREADELVLEIEVYDLASRQLMAEKRFAEETSWGWRFAGDVVEALRTLFTVPSASDAGRE